MEGSASISSFSAVDYCIFSITLVGSLGIGVYYCVKGNRTTDDFLLAGRAMSPIPIALSLTATHISAIGIIGFTGEVYGHGIQLMWSLLGSLLGVLVAVQVFVPVVFPLKLDSINEYLELRFRSPLLKKLVMLMTSLSSLLYLGVCLYAPTLALEAVTPLKSEAYIVLLGLIVTLYASFGGMKAVVWTDALQAVVMVLGVVTALVAATVVAGGPARVWVVSTEGGRTDALDFRLGLFIRHTVFNTMLNNTLKFTALYAFQQTTVQRLTTLKSLREARMVLYINMFGVTAIQALLFIGGLSIFAVYAGCDPITLGAIATKDQILPYFIIDYLGFLRGVPGLFVACLLCGTMSSISSYLNSLPTMLWKDLIAELPYFQRASERTRTLTTKLMTFTFGMLMMGLAFTASRMGGLIQANSTLLGILAGPNMGIFFLGICVPFCNRKGALAGTIVAIGFMAWLGIGTQLYGTKPELLPLHASACPTNLTRLSQESTTSSAGPLLTFGPDAHVSDAPGNQMPDAPDPGIYAISYTFLSSVGAAVCVAVGIAVSCATGREKLDEVDPKLILPCLRKYVPENPDLDAAELQRFLQEESSRASKNNVETEHLKRNVSAGMEQ